MALGRFEQLCKMTRIGPEPLSTTSGPLPVKFRPVYFDPSIMEEADSDVTSLRSDEFEMDEEVLHADLSFNGQHFFKDPLCPSFIEDTETSITEEKSELSSKLGHNMRACGSRKIHSADKSVWSQMSARNQLLEEQRRQHEAFNKRDSTSREATALVNNLLQQGFHITPPEQTPRLDESCLKSASDDDPLSSVIREEGELVKSIHKELKRVQGVVAPSAPSPL